MSSRAFLVTPMPKAKYFDLNKDAIEFDVCISVPNAVIIYSYSYVFLNDKWRDIVLLMFH